jgi:hypothetical protein
MYDKRLKAIIECNSYKQVLRSFRVHCSDYTSACQVAKSEKKFALARKINQQFAKQLSHTVLAPFHSVTTNKFQTIE